ncbi:hypothetical protein D1P53_002246 [Cryptococcus gattii VGV]|nr:hypothetical protein D1P53_002246 [Cryptococcus gattii VGV]
MDLAAHARDSATMSKIANSDTGGEKKASSEEGPYLEVRENRKDRGGVGGGGSGRSGWGGRRVQNRGARGGHASEKRGGDGGTGSGPCDEGDGDTSTKRSHNLSADHDRDQFIDALGAPPEAEGVGWKGSGWLTQAERYNWLNDWLENLPQTEKPIDIPNNGVSPSTPPLEDVLAHLAMDAIEYQELRIANVLGDLGVHFVSVSSAQMDELFSANPSAIITSTQDKRVNHRLKCSSLLRFCQNNSEWRQTDNTSDLRGH